MIIMTLGSGHAQENSIKEGVWGRGIHFNIGITQFKTKQINQALSSVGVSNRLPFIHMSAGTEIVGYLGKFYILVGSYGVWAPVNTESKVNAQGVLWAFGGGYFFIIKEKFGMAIDGQWQFYNVVVNIHNPPATVPNTFTSTLLTTNNFASFNLTNQAIFLGLNLGLWGSDQSMWGFKAGATVTYHTKWRYSGQTITNPPSYVPLGFVGAVYFML